MTDLIRRKQPGEAWETATDSGGSQPANVDIIKVGGTAPQQPFLLLTTWQRVGGTLTPLVSSVGLVIPWDATSYEVAGLEAIADAVDYQQRGGTAWQAPLLESLAFPDLLMVGGSFYPYSLGALTTLDVSALASVGGSFSPNNLGALTSLDLSALASVGGDFYPQGLGALTTLDVSALASVGGDFYPQSLGALTTLDVSALASVGGNFNPDSLGALTTLDLSALASVGGDFSPQSLGALTTLDISGLLAVLNNYFAVTGAALTQATVNAILVKLASLDGTAGTTSFDGGTVDLSGGTSASPSAPGLAAKVTLEARGNTVTVN